MASRADLVSQRAEAALAASQLARGASLEMSGLDEGEFAAARAHLEPGQKIFVSHLPGQTWRRTF